MFSSVEVQEFFCLNDPPGPYDSLEESRVSFQHNVCYSASLCGVYIPRPTLNLCGFKLKFDFIL